MTGPQINRDVFHAIADPVRRDIIHRIGSDVKTVNDIASEFDISRPAISRHMKVLRECGVVQMETEGRKRLCRINWQCLRDLDSWLASYRSHWEVRYDELDSYLHKLQSK